MESSKEEDIRISENAVGGEISKTEVDMNDSRVDGSNEIGTEVGESVYDKAGSSRDPCSILFNTSPTTASTESICE